VSRDDADLHDFYERYIAAFNARDESAFIACFHLPVTIVALPPADEQAAETAPVVVTDPAHLWPKLPPTWTRSTIDEVRVLGGDTYRPRDGFTEGRPRRAALQVTVTRWAGDDPYEQVHVLYLLANQGGRLGITTMVPLALAARR
jgi:hypothetical protein